jgi:hypothetical protein
VNEKMAITKGFHPGRAVVDHVREHSEVAMGRKRSRQQGRKSYRMGSQTLGIRTDVPLDSWICETRMCFFFSWRSQIWQR